MASATTDKEILVWANSVAAAWGDRVAQMLGVPAATVTFKLVDSLSGGAPAQTNGTVVSLSRQWFKDFAGTGGNPDPGAIISELVHADQQIDQSVSPNAAVEGFSDAVRYKLSQQYPNAGLLFPGWQPSAAAARLAALPEEQFKQRSQAVSAPPKPGGGTQPVAPPPAVSTIQFTQTPQGELIPRPGGQAPELTPPPVGTPITLPDGSTYVTNPDGTITLTTPAGAVKQFSGIQGLADWIKAQNQSTKVQIQNQEASFRSVLGAWNIKETPSIDQLVQKAAQGGWNSARFLEALRQTQEYQNAFPGIRPGMSESAYRNTVNQYQAAADRYGIDLTPGKKQALIAGNVRPDVFTMRAQAFAVIRDNPQEFKIFVQRAEAAGLGMPTRGDLLSFVMGAKPREWLDVWNGTQIQLVAKNEGLNLGNKGVEKIQQMTAGVSLPSVLKNVADFAQKVRTTLTTQEARSFGLSRSDLLAAEFGGPGAGYARDKLQRVLDTNQAFFAQRFAHQPMQVSQGGFASLGGFQDQAQVQ